MRLISSPDQKFRVPSTMGIVMPRLYDNNYYALARYLHAHTGAQDSVAYGEIGILHYFADRTIIDYLGLATPHVAEHLLSGDAVWYFKAYHPTVYVDTNDLFVSGLASPFEYDWFLQAYEPAGDLSLPSDPGRDHFRLFRLRAPLAIPPRETQIFSTAAHVSGDGRSITFSTAIQATAVDLRLRTEKCLNGSVELYDASKLIASRLVHPNPLSEIERLRFSLPTSPTPNTQYALRLRGCNAGAIAPPLMPNRRFIIFNSPLVTGTPESALSVYANDR